MVLNVVRFVFCFFLIFSFNKAHARWETREDTATEIRFYNRSIDVKSNGTYTELIEFKTVPTKEDAGETLATQPIFYDASSSEFRVLKATTKFQDKEYEISNDLIEDKPVASTPIGFHQINQVLIKFPHVKKGAELYLKYQIKMNQPAVPNFFSTNFVYGQEGYWLASQVKVTSEIPLYIQKNDKEDFLEINQSESAGKSIMTIQLKRPVIKRVIDEPLPFLNFRHFPWVSVSTAPDWSQLAKIMVGQYEKIASQDLPALFQGIVKEASTKESEYEKINTVTSELATHIKYMGDWRTTYNHWFPHDLEQIAKYGQGDCKDFAIATTAILRKLGIHANVAAVQRGEMNVEFPVDSPNTAAFNHLIVRVKSGNQTLWIDPTNLASFAHGLFPDIANRSALVFDPTALGKERIPSLKTSESEIVIQENIELSKTDQLSKLGRIDFKGTSALSLTGAELRASKEAINHSLVRYLSDENRIKQWKIGDYNLTSRTARDIFFNYEVVEKPAEIKTDAGPGYPLQPGYYASTLLTKTHNRVSDLFLGSPAKVKKTYLLKNVSRVSRQFSGCTIKSKWIDLSRRISDLKKAGIQVSDEAEVKTGLISDQDLMTPEFNALQNQIEKCFNGVAIIYKKSM